VTLDGSGQSVTFDGGNSTQVLVVNGGTVSITNSTIVNNTGDYGVGLFDNFGTATITNSTIANNTAIMPQ
jgi:hypothetical protein